MCSWICPGLKRRLVLTLACRSWIILGQNPADDLFLTDYSLKYIGYKIDQNKLHSLDFSWKWASLVRKLLKSRLCLVWGVLLTSCVRTTQGCVMCRGNLLHPIRNSIKWGIINICCTFNHMHSTKNYVPVHLSASETFKVGIFQSKLNIRPQLIKLSTPHCLLWINRISVKSPSLILLFERKISMHLKHLPGSFTHQKSLSAVLDKWEHSKLCVKSKRGKEEW